MPERSRLVVSCMCAESIVFIQLDATQTDHTGPPVEGGSNESSAVERESWWRADTTSSCQDTRRLAHT